MSRIFHSNTNQKSTSNLSATLESHEKSDQKIAELPPRVDLRNEHTQLNEMSWVDRTMLPVLRIIKQSPEIVRQQVALIYGGYRELFKGFIAGINSGNNIIESYGQGIEKAGKYIDQYRRECEERRDKNRIGSILGDDENFIKGNIVSDLITLHPIMAYANPVMEVADAVYDEALLKVTNESLKLVGSEEQLNYLDLKRLQVEDINFKRGKQIFEITKISSALALNPTVATTHGMTKQLHVASQMLKSNVLFSGVISTGEELKHLSQSPKDINFFESLTHVAENTLSNTANSMGMSGVTEIARSGYLGFKKLRLPSGNRYSVDSRQKAVAGFNLGNDIYQSIDDLCDLLESSKDASLNADLTNPLSILGHALVIGAGTKDFLGNGPNDRRDNNPVEANHNPRFKVIKLNQKDLVAKFTQWRISEQESIIGDPVELSLVIMKEAEDLAGFYHPHEKIAYVQKLELDNNSPETLQRMLHAGDVVHENAHHLYIIEHRGLKNPIAEEVYALKAEERYLSAHGIEVDYLNGAKIVRYSAERAKQVIDKIRNKEKGETTESDIKREDNALSLERDLRREEYVLLKYENKRLLAGKKPLHKELEKLSTLSVDTRTQQFEYYRHWLLAYDEVDKIIDPDNLGNFIDFFQNPKALSPFADSTTEISEHTLNPNRFILPEQERSLRELPFLNLTAENLRSSIYDGTLDYLQMLPAFSIQYRLYIVNFHDSENRAVVYTPRQLIAELFREKHYKGRSKLRMELFKAVNDYLEARKDLELSAFKLPENFERGDKSLVKIYIEHGLRKSQFKQDLERDLIQVCTDFFDNASSEIKSLASKWLITTLRIKINFTAKSDPRSMATGPCSRFGTTEALFNQFNPSITNFTVEEQLDWDDHDSESAAQLVKHGGGIPDVEQIGFSYLSLDHYYDGQIYNFTTNNEFSRYARFLMIDPLLRISADSVQLWNYSGNKPASEKNEGGANRKKEIDKARLKTLLRTEYMPVILVDAIRKYLDYLGISEAQTELLVGREHSQFMEKLSYETIFSWQDSPYVPLIPLSISDRNKGDYVVTLSRRKFIEVNRNWESIFPFSHLTPNAEERIFFWKQKMRESSSELEGKIIPLSSIHVRTIDAIRVANDAIRKFGCSYYEVLPIIIDQIQRNKSSTSFLSQNNNALYDGYLLGYKGNSSELASDYDQDVFVIHDLDLMPYKVRLEFNETTRRHDIYIEEFEVEEYFLEYLPSKTKSLLKAFFEVYLFNISKSKEQPDTLPPLLINMNSNLVLNILEDNPKLLADILSEYGLYIESQATKDGFLVFSLRFKNIPKA